MNPILADIYSTVIPSAPFVIAAYALVWAVLLIYVIKVVRGLKKTEEQIKADIEAVKKEASPEQIAFADMATGLMSMLMDLAD